MAVTDAPVAERLWADRLEGAYAYRSLHASGARLALGSDAAVAAMDPLPHLRDAVLAQWRARRRARTGRAPRLSRRGAARVARGRGARHGGGARGADRHARLAGGRRGPPRAA